MFKDNFTRLRKKAHMTHAELASELGVSLRTLQNWAQGHRAPAIGMLPPLAQALGVTVDELLRGEPRPVLAKSRPRKPADA